VVRAVPVEVAVPSTWPVLSEILTPYDEDPPDECATPVVSAVPSVTERPTVFDSLVTSDWLSEAAIPSDVPCDSL
jgi:hypothetical protein